MTFAPRGLRVGPGRYYKAPPTTLTVEETRRANACEALGLVPDVPDAVFKALPPPRAPDPEEWLTVSDLQTAIDMVGGHR